MRARALRDASAVALALPAITLAALAVLVAPAATPALATTGDGVRISGVVHLDLDGDGDRDDGEPGRGAVQLTLRTEAAILDATVSAADGSWSFSNVAPGTVTLTIEPPNDLVVTGSTVPGLGAGATEAALDLTEDADLGTIGLGSPLTSGPDVAVTVTADDGSSGWTITALNLGDASAPGPVAVRAVLSPGHEATDASGEGWACEVSSAIVLCSSAGDLAAATTLPPLSLTTVPVGAVGSVLTVTGTVRLPGAFDEAPLNDEDVASRRIGGELVAGDVDGDGSAELSETGARVTGLLVAALLALVVGATTVTTGRRSRRP